MRGRSAAGAFSVRTLLKRINPPRRAYFTGFEDLKVAAGSRLEGISREIAMERSATSRDPLKLKVGLVDIFYNRDSRGHLRGKFEDFFERDSLVH
jgi:hypothetical protein